MPHRSRSGNPGPGNKEKKLSPAVFAKADAIRKKEGKSRDQSLAIAASMLGESRKKKKKS